jgi:hypothetical protein
VPKKEDEEEKEEEGNEKNLKHIISDPSRP